MRIDPGHNRFQGTGLTHSLGRDTPVAMSVPTADPMDRLSPLSPLSRRTHEAGFLQFHDVIGAIGRVTQGAFWLGLTLTTAGLGFLATAMAVMAPFVGTGVSVSSLMLFGPATAVSGLFLTGVSYLYLKERRENQVTANREEQSHAAQNIRISAAPTPSAVPPAIDANPAASSPVSVERPMPVFDPTLYPISSQEVFVPPPFEAPFFQELPPEERPRPFIRGNGKSGIPGDALWQLMEKDPVEVAHRYGGVEGAARLARQIADRFLQLYEQSVFFAHELTPLGRRLHSISGAVTPNDSDRIIWLAEFGRTLWIHMPPIGDEERPDSVVNYFLARLFIRDEIFKRSDPAVYEEIVRARIGFCLGKMETYLDEPNLKRATQWALLAAGSDPAIFQRMIDNTLQGGLHENLRRGRQLIRRAEMKRAAKEWRQSAPARDLRELFHDLKHDPEALALKVVRYLMGAEMPTQRVAGAIVAIRDMVNDIRPHMPREWAGQFAWHFWSHPALGGMPPIWEMAKQISILSGQIQSHCALGNAMRSLSLRNLRSAVVWVQLAQSVDLNILEKILYSPNHQMRLPLKALMEFWEMREPDPHLPASRKVTD